MSYRDKHKVKTNKSFKGNAYVMCGRKATFKRDRVKELTKSYNQRAYECPHCGLYHLTTKPKKW